MWAQACEFAYNMHVCASAEKRQGRREQAVYAIRPVPKHYAWGSHRTLQHVFHLNEHETQQPLAEMWFSGHAQSPSSVMVDGTEQPLTSMIERNPIDMVGRRGSEEFGPVLPYLFKLICATEPLSLQVHPVSFQARAGFNEENRAGIPLDAPERSFKDINAKSEMVVALEPFLAAVGFSTRTFALRNLGLLRLPVAQRMVEALNSTATQSAGESFVMADEMMPIASAVWSPARKRLFRAFHAAITAQETDPQELLDDLQHARSLAEHTRNDLAFDFAIRAAKAFPGDTSALALLMMNPVSLEEGQSVFLPTGTPHAYIYGTAAEIMTNSDNVLRAGLTVKHKDIVNLLQCLDCRTSTPVDPSNSQIATMLMRDLAFYKPNVSEYMLAYGQVDVQHEPWPVINALAKRYDSLVRQISGHTPFPHSGPRVVVCTQGSVQVISEADSRVLHQGDAVFVPASDGWAHVEAVIDGEGEPQGKYLVASTPF